MTSSKLRIELFTGLVRRGETTLAVNQREKALLYALAIARRRIARDDLLAALWPDLELDAARNALGVSLHRLRRQLGDSDAVVRSAFGYALGPGVGVDLWDAEDLLRRIGRRGPVPSADRGAAERAFRNLLGSYGPRIRSLGEGFEQLEQRLDALRAVLGSRLAEDAFARNDAAGALAYANALADLDPCDEPVRELAIRAHLALGDRPSAVREFRAYQRTIALELGVEPSIQLRRMLEERAEAATFAPRLLVSVAG